MIAAPDGHDELADSGEVLVLVSTVRYSPQGEIEVVRESRASGDFDQAVRRALQERLAPWAVDQVLGRILARRPPRGVPVEYEGWFNQDRQILIAARPCDQPSRNPAGPRRVLKGLFLPLPTTTQAPDTRHTRP